MDAHTVPRDTVTRAVAADFGRLLGIRPFYATALMRLSRRDAAELCKAAVREHPRDLEDRGLYLRYHAARTPRSPEGGRGAL